MIALDDAIVDGPSTSTHPAFSPAVAILLRTCPDAAHVELEANEVDAVLGAALGRLSAAGDERAAAYLRAIPTFQRLTVALAVLGQALRVPVRLRGGCCDRKGKLHVGNSLGALLGTLSGRIDDPYTGRGATKVCEQAKDAGESVRAPRLYDVAWTEVRPDGTTIERKRRFGRSVLYGAAPALRGLYRREELAGLVVEVAKIMPGAWRRRAYLVRGSRGYWGAIRRSKVEVAVERRKAGAARRRRESWERYKRRSYAVKNGVQTSKAKRENSSRGESQVPAGAAPSIAATAGRGGSRDREPVLDSSTSTESDPKQGCFADRMAAEGLDVDAWGLNGPRSGLRPRVDRRPDVRPAESSPPSRSREPWHHARYRL